MNIEDYSVNDRYWCGPGVPTSLSPCELRELANDEYILLGNKVRIALNDSAELKEAVLRDVPDVREVCRSHGHNGCLEKLDHILDLAKGK